MKNTLSTLKDLIAIPSWVGEDCNEIKIGNYIYEFLKNKTNLAVYKQELENGRFNVIAQNDINPDILVTGHMDTVPPSEGWTKNPIEPVVKNGKVYGLGSTDMLSGIAIMLEIARKKNLKEKIMFLFYCDEEYDFLGMKTFISKMRKKINPKLIISLDREGLRVSNSCRGLIELKVKVKGIAGHAANPQSGVNAIYESFKVITDLKEWLKKFRSRELGESTLNIAYINGGSNQGNIIAEKCEYIVEIRVANEKLNADLVGQFIRARSKKFALEIEGITTKHDLGSWTTKKKDLSSVIKLSGKKSLEDVKKSGYVDIQMLWEAFNKVPTFSFGIGEGGMSHKADEFVRISSLEKGQRFFEKLLLK